jgi:hypothetical protein
MHEVFSNLTASSSSTSLVFSGSPEGTLYLVDDVNLVSNATVPEPSTMVTLLAGLGLLALAHRLRRRAIVRHSDRPHDPGMPTFCVRVRGRPQLSRIRP